jgi:hypothetical protein
MDIEPVRTLENAMKPIIDEIFQNGFEEGCRIWEDPANPLHEAIMILLGAQAQFMGKEAVALLEHHRRMEEGR